ncbi:Abi family protein [Phocaeicola barnesiae]|uniref:Abi family protein n=1 Tax=Phocaeicola barnesiae TaxID=376804 RepID=UPI00241C4989|nr:Abi family protein [Phocaeicola barnesiae]
MLKSGVVLFLCMTIHFHKTYQTPADIVALLQSRGLNIDNPKRAEHYIRSIGYYRFSAYLYPLLQMPKEAHQYKVGSTFQDALNLYRFDKKLRLFLFNEIEKVEIALRSALANIAAEETGNIFWMTDVSMFANEDKFNRTMTLVDKELTNSKEDFILHFKKKYSNTYPPAWMLMEILPLGIVTRIYENIKSNALKKKISGYFNLPVPMFISWLTVITLTRNSCCHHSRVWNKIYAVNPKVAKKKLKRPWISEEVSPYRTFYEICIIKWFVDIVSPNNDMKIHLQELWADFPMIDIKAMGFPTNWQEEPLWKE